jgi:CDGSH-type Zn-finger protein/uncharacterized Fe-S cluster protein YjdI
MSLRRLRIDSSGKDSTLSDQYTRKDMDRRYSGEAVDITYSAKRCIHAEECIHRMGQVFDAKRRPWIMPGDTSAAQAAEVIVHCPSGALHFDDKSGALVEAVPATNIIAVWDNGPLQFTGDLRIEGATVAIEHETRATLCRCGASQNKPFCDNSHKVSGFEGTTVASMTAMPLSEGGPLKVTVVPNGPLRIEGAFTLYNAQNEVLAISSEAVNLCRCGESSRKPFCDGTHLTNGFSGE